MFSGQPGQRGNAAQRHRLGQTEIEQLRSRFGDHDVAGLQVAMNDPGAMSLVQRLADLNAIAQHLIDRQRTLRKPIGE